MLKSRYSDSPLGQARDRIKKREEEKKRREEQAENVSAR